MSPTFCSPGNAIRGEGGNDAKANICNFKGSWTTPSERVPSDCTMPPAVAHATVSADRITFGGVAIAQTVFVCVISYAFIMAHMHLWPYRFLYSNIVKTVAECQLFFVLEVSLVMRFTSDTLDSENFPASN